MTVLIFLMLVFLHRAAAHTVNVTEYLINYGYLHTTENAVTNLQEDLYNFQEFYGLPMDGTINNETLEFMAKSRCGVSDDPLTFSLSGGKWIKRHLKWFFSQSTVEKKNVAQAAFNVWENVVNLKFDYLLSNPDILISLSSGTKSHIQNSRCLKGICWGNLNFDGSGGVLAHAFSPNNDECREIHLDRSENWYLDYQKVPEVSKDKTRLLWVLAHEIGEKDKNFTYSGETAETRI